jgi:hypothetical protein
MIGRSETMFVFQPNPAASKQVIICSTQRAGSFLSELKRPAALSVCRPNGADVRNEENGMETHTNFVKRHRIQARMGLTTLP